MTVTAVVLEVTLVKQVITVILMELDTVVIIVTVARVV